MSKFTPIHEEAIPYTNRNLFEKALHVAYPMCMSQSSVMTEMRVVGEHLVAEWDHLTHSGKIYVLDETTQRKLSAIAPPVSHEVTVARAQMLSECGPVRVGMLSESSSTFQKKIFAFFYKEPEGLDPAGLSAFRDKNAEKQKGAWADLGLTPDKATGVWAGSRQYDTSPLLHVAVKKEDDREFWVMSVAWFDKSMFSSKAEAEANMVKKFNEEGFAASFNFGSVYVAKDAAALKRAVSLETNLREVMPKLIAKSVFDAPLPTGDSIAYTKELSRSSTKGLVKLVDKYLLTLTPTESGVGFASPIPYVKFALADSVSAAALYVNKLGFKTKVFKDHKGLPSGFEIFSK